MGARHKRGGYGEFRLNGQKLRVHRHAWELTHGPIPSGHVVLHRCDNPACFEPTHLELGTQHDNLLDMVAKGRGANQYGLYGARA